jgi:hypothetical protein
VQRLVTNNRLLLRSATDVSDVIARVQNIFCLENYEM